MIARPTEGRRCVWCRRHPIADAWRPFCSERCKLQDLARWADGSYRIPGAVAAETESDEDDEGGTRER